MKRMRHELIEIKVPGYEETGKLYTYILDNSVEMNLNRKRPLVLICPGGAYRFTSDREAEPIAMQFLAKGYHAAILRYAVAPSEYPEALLQLGSSVKYLKEHAEEYHIDPDKIVIQGFSAGGHLAASYGVFWNRKDIFQTIGEAKELKPAGLLLCYPVITSGELSHQESMHNLLGDRYDLLKEQMSLDKQVSKDTPPTFLWHTATDNSVPVENSILFFMALKQAGVPVEMHIYPCGEHGLALANFETSNKDGFGIQKECESWITLACDWMEQFR